MADCCALIAIFFLRKYILKSGFYFRGDGTLLGRRITRAKIAIFRVFQVARLKLKAVYEILMSFVAFEVLISKYSAGYWLVLKRVKREKR